MLLIDTQQRGLLTLPVIEHCFRVVGLTGRLPTEKVLSADSVTLPNWCVIGEPEVAPVRRRSHPRGRCLFPLLEPLVLDRARIDRVIPV